MSRNQNDLTAEQEGRFRLAAELSVKVLGGTWESVSRALEAEADTRLHTVSVRRWLVNRTLPCRMAFALAAAVNRAKGSEVVSPADFHPWLEKYL